jgi:hypothetical protein
MSPLRPPPFNSFDALHFQRGSIRALAIFAVLRLERIRQDGSLRRLELIVRFVWLIIRWIGIRGSSGPAHNLHERNRRGDRAFFLIFSDGIIKRLILVWHR